MNPCERQAHWKMGICEGASLNLLIPSLNEIKGELKAVNTRIDSLRNETKTEFGALGKEIERATEKKCFLSLKGCILLLYAAVCRLQPVPDKYKRLNMPRLRSTVRTSDRRLPHSRGGNSK
jgi:hypothetical protein